MKKYHKMLLAVIVLLAFILRFYKLGENPPSLTWDEAAWGYNAYSLGIDGKDEFGRFLPLDYLESFGDYKPPVYAYLTILPVKFFGLNEFAVRFPSALFGVLTVLATYYLVKELFKIKNKKITHYPLPITNYALLSAALLAISPWHINLSRAAFEANVAQFFIVTGVWLFLKAANLKPGFENKKSLTLFLGSTIAFILSLYTFNTARVVAPLLVLMLSIGFYKRLLASKKWVIIAGFVGILFSMPFIRFMLTPQAKLRFHEVNIFSDLSIIETANREIANDNNAVWSRVIHNRRWGYTREYIKHYLDHFNPGFLFVKGDGNPKFSTQDIGQLYLWDLPFIIIGVLLLVRKREGYWWIIPVWLLLGIVPAATARETPHALRIETTLPMWQVLVAYGIVNMAKWLNGQMVKISNFKFQISNLSVCLLVGIPLLLNIVYYLHGYYFHYPIEYSGEWQYGYKEAIEYTESVKEDYDKIVFTTELGRPYIYTLFYSKTNPQVFRKTADIKREVLGFVHVNGFGKYIFTKDPSSVKSDGQKTLYIDVSNKVPEAANKQAEFKLLNGNSVLVAYVL
jgi:4-amino-4-deoxy-L-arabinose transferase-like glycosyltransferase